MKTLYTEFLKRYADPSREKRGQKMMLRRHIEKKTAQWKHFDGILRALSLAAEYGNYGDMFNVALRMFDETFEDEIYN